MAYLGKQEELGMWKEWLGTVQGLVSSQKWISAGP